MYQDNVQLRELYLDFIENFCFGEKPEPKTNQSNISEQISTRKYPIWPNRDALCWLNATMALLVHCNSLKKLYMVDKLPDCQIRKLFQDYYSLLEKVNSTSAHTQDDDNIYYALTEMQEQAFEFLAQNQGCKKGVNDSPIFAIPLLLKEKEEVLRIFKFNHKWSIQCEECQWQKTQRANSHIKSFQELYAGFERAAKVMLTFPKVSENFSFEQPVSLCSCLRCLAPDQKRLLIYERLPQSIILHFEQGAGKTKLDEYDFTFENNGYYLSCVVLYTGAGQTSHFITWIRNIEDETWLNCDDLLENPRQFGKEAPNISGKEIHLMVLERSENKNGDEDDSQSVSNSVDTIYSSSVSSEQTVITLDSDDSQDLTLVVDKDFEHITQPCIAHTKQLVTNNSSKLKSLDKIHQSAEQSSNCNSFLSVDSLVMKKQSPASLSNTTEVGFLDVFTHTENLSSHSETVANALTLSNKTSPKSSKCFHAVPLLLSKENINDVPASVTTDGKHNTSYETNSELPMKRLTFHDTVMVDRENLLVLQRPTRVRKRKVLDDYLYPDNTKGQRNLLLKEVPLKRKTSQQTIKELTISKKREQVQNCQHITVMHRILKAKDKSAKKINRFAEKNIVPAEKISELQLFRSCKTYSKKTPNIALQSPQETIINISSISNSASGLGKHVENNAKVSEKMGKTCSLVTATHRISKDTNWSENNGFLKLSMSLKTYSREKPKSPTHITDKWPFDIR